MIMNEINGFWVNYLSDQSANYSQAATWPSGDPALATVSNVYGPKGEVTGVIAGIVAITASASGATPALSDSKTITVSQLGCVTVK